MGERKLRDIEAMPVTAAELRQYQLKIAAAGEMKSAIKKLADSADFGLNDGYMVPVRMKYLNRAIKMMEAYLNVDNPEAVACAD